VDDHGYVSRSSFIVSIGTRFRRVKSVGGIALRVDEKHLARPLSLIFVEILAFGLPEKMAAIVTRRPIA
jgi:hypothetical protein